MVTQYAPADITPIPVIPGGPLLAPAYRIEAALARARAGGARVRRSADPAVYLVSSVSRPGLWHRVDTARATCDCEGFARGYLCLHLAAVGSALRLAAPPVRLLPAPVASAPAAPARRPVPGWLAERRAVQARRATRARRPAWLARVLAS